MGAASTVAGVVPAELETASGKVRVACAMSTPRLGWQDHVFCWPRGLLPYRIAPVRFEGAFWDACLDRVLTDIVEADDDPSLPPLWILTLDYDTVFEQDAVPRLLTYAAASDYDFVAAVQMKRRVAEPLFTMVNEDGERISEVKRGELLYNNIVPANTAHFGLSLLRASALKKLPRPWFKGVPNEEGKWGDGRTDSDIWFWNQAKKAGLKAGICTRVAVGHIECWIKWPDKGMGQLLQHPSDFWDKNGRPPEECWS